LNKNVAVEEWRTIIEELEEKHEDVLSRLQVIFIYFFLTHKTGQRGN
jgi:hypothetical protein